MTNHLTGRHIVVDLVAAGGGDGVHRWFDSIQHHDTVLGPPADDAPVPRRIIAHALNLALFSRLLAHVDSARDYVEQQRIADRRILIDHGAVRTVVLADVHPLLTGASQVARVLEPLGFTRRDAYPMPRLAMTGYAYAHDDLPDDIAQWFVSELYPDRFDASFVAAVTRTLASTTDALDDTAHAHLGTLAEHRELALDAAVELMPALVQCFTRRHQPPHLDDYERLLADSDEMAWIATEGTTFNHATDRVPNVAATADAERAAGRPLKDSVEVSANGRVRQTAHRAASVRRSFRTGIGLESSVVERDVPGSFFEFIERRPIPETGRLDLSFDAANAQAIFAMTNAIDATTQSSSDR